MVQTGFCQVMCHNKNVYYSAQCKGTYPSLKSIPLLQKIIKSSKTFECKTKNTSLGKMYTYSDRRMVRPQISIYSLDWKLRQKTESNVGGSC